MRAIVYSRVSTDAQERDGTSLDTQERACMDFARQQGWRVVEAIRDAASGFSLDRDGIERVRELLRAGLVDVVIAYAVDRLSRNQNQIGVIFDEISRPARDCSSCPSGSRTRRSGGSSWRLGRSLPRSSARRSWSAPRAASWSGRSPGASRRPSAGAATATCTTRPPGSARSSRSRRRSSGGSSSATPSSGASTRSATS
jgi:hypothetical protein